MKYIPPEVKRVKDTEQNKSKSWPYCGHRVKRWKEKNGVGVFTVISTELARAIKREAIAHKKPQWKLLRASIQYGFQTAMRRGF